MPTVVVAVAKLVAASGIQAQTHQVQLASPSQLAKIIESGPIHLSEKIAASDGFSTSESLVQLRSATQTEKIRAASEIESTASINFLVFSSDFSRSVNLYGVIGTSGTLEKFFDHSPFFYTPSEVNPNLLRDISSAQQFLVYTQTTINTIDTFHGANSVVSLFSVKGSELDPDFPQPQLLETSSFAHILTTHPTASGVPFTISGSVDITQTDETVPFFDEETPVRDSTFNDPRDRDVVFHIKDAGSAVDQASIQVFIDGVKVVNAGAVNTSATWPSIIKTIVSPKDIQYNLHRGLDFSQQAVVVVSGTFADLASPANGTTQTYSFKMLGSGTLPASITGLTDSDPPSIIPVEPHDLQTQVSPNTTLTWSITDNSAGVNPNSVKLTLNDTLVIANDLASEGSFSRIANSSRGFDYTYFPAHPFSFGTTVTGTIQATDFAPLLNTGTLTYTFDITPTDSLSILNFFLDQNESTLVTPAAFGSVEVVDTVYGVASGTTTLTINGDEPIGLLTTFSGSGPDRVIFSWPLEENNSFRHDLLVHVHAENQFPGPFPVIKEADYLLRSGYDVHWYNKSADGSAIAEQVFPYLTNVYVNLEAKNFAINFNEATEFFRFLVEEQAKADLGAFIEANIKTADLSAEINALNPYFEYGKTMTLELEVADLEGNQLRFVHVFTIEDRP